MALLNTGFRRSRLLAIDSHSFPARLTGLAGACATFLAVLNLLIAAHGIVPAYLAAQDNAIRASASRHGLPAEWLGAVLYNEMLGTEDQVLRAAIPGEAALPRTARSVLLGIHFMSLKQLQWQAKAVAAAAGADPTIGPAGIRVSVGREIRAEEQVAGGGYVAAGALERPSMIVDLLTPATAIEYLAANLQRGQDRLAPADRGDWEASARWHNTGVVYDSAIVKPEDWEKGNRYVARVRSSLPLAAALLADGVPGETGDPAQAQAASAPEAGEMALAPAGVSRH